MGVVQKTLKQYTKSEDTIQLVSMIYYPLGSWIFDQLFIYLSLYEQILLLMKQYVYFYWVMGNLCRVNDSDDLVISTELIIYTLMSFKHDMYYSPKIYILIVLGSGQLPTTNTIK